MIPFDKREFLADLGGDIFRPQLMGVFRLDGWDFVTNGHALLRVRGESPTSKTTGLPPIGPILARSRPSNKVASMGALCTWAALGGCYRRRCGYCGSPDDLWETDRIEFVGGIEINRALLWHYLNPLPQDGSVTVSWGEPLSAILIAHEDWELYVMPLGAPDPKYSALFEFNEPDTSKAYIAKAVAK